jgi:hypothetical protein
MNAGWPPTIPLFEVDGAVDSDDRIHLLNLYSGIAFDAPVITMIAKINGVVVTGLRAIG